MPELKLARYSLIFLWLFTGLTSLFFARSTGYDILAEAGVEGSFATLCLLSGSLVDLALGLWLSTEKQRRLCYLVQLVVIVVYSVLLLFIAPDYWLHPFGPVTKNLPILALLLILLAKDPLAEGSLWRWEKGRQQTGYDKLLLMTARWPLKFDLYLLRFPQGVSIPPHTDPVQAGRHYRLNLLVKKAHKGGDFVCQNPIFESDRIKLFRPDVSEHSVTPVEEGSRYLISLGWVRK